MRYRMGRALLFQRITTTKSGCNPFLRLFLFDLSDFFRKIVEFYC
jgi:hypothetical protein